MYLRYWGYFLGHWPTFDARAEPVYLTKTIFALCSSKQTKQVSMHKLLV